MSYFWVGLASFAAGIVLCRLYYNKLIAKAKQYETQAATAIGKRFGS